MKPILILLVLAVSLFSRANASEPIHNWPSWRGPLSSGVSPLADPPVNWDEQTNVRWKSALPGRGHSTPIIWDDHIFLSAAIPVGETIPPQYSGRPGAHDNLPVTSRQQFVVMAIDRLSGEVIWQKVVREALPIEGGHNTASLASASPVTDGKHVVAFFGSHGLYCVDFNGNIVWEKQLGTMHTKHGHGEGCSPVLTDGRLVINWDHEEQSFVACFDVKSGDELWRNEREEVTSWSTPLVVEHDGHKQVIVCGTDRVRSYDLVDGQILWECGGLSANIVASPVSANGIVYVGSSYEKRALLAIDLNQASGDITDTAAVLWTTIRGTPYVPSLLLYDDALYFLRHYQGILTRVHGPTGEQRPGPMRLGVIGDVYASPVGASGRIYVTDRNGTTMVITHDDEPKLLAINRIEEEVNASLSIAGNDLFLRTVDHLYCISATETQPDKE